MRREAAPEDRSLASLLGRGELDGQILSDSGVDNLADNLQMRRLWPDYREVEADYFRRTGIFPMRHLLVVKEALLSQDRQLVKRLVALFEQAKQIAYRYWTDHRRSSLAWFGAQQEEERALLGADPRLIDTVPNFQAAALQIKRSWAEKNRAVMVRFMKAMVLSNRWLHDNRDAAVDFMAKEMQLKPAHALEGWEYYTQNRLWSLDGEPNIEGMKHNLRVYAELSAAKRPGPDVLRFLDLSYLHDALAELGRR